MSSWPTADVLRKLVSAEFTAHEFTELLPICRSESLVFGYRFVRNVTVSFSLLLSYETLMLASGNGAFTHSNSSRLELR